MKFKYILKVAAAVLVLALVISAVSASRAELPMNNGILSNSENLKNGFIVPDIDAGRLPASIYTDSYISQKPLVSEKIPSVESEILPESEMQKSELYAEAESAPEAEHTEAITPPNADKANEEQFSQDIKQSKKVLDVPYINQRTYFPNGCESVSAVMALQYFGVEISAGDFIRDYLDMGSAPHYFGGKLVACDPREAFPGDPRNDSGWGCYPEVIKASIDKMELESLEAVILKDVSLSALCREYIDRDIPVVLWGTIDMTKPSSWVSWTIDGADKVHTWISPFHCLLLVGYDDECYYFNDPWRQKEKCYGKDAVERAYTGIGREALVIVEK